MPVGELTLGSDHLERMVRSNALAGLAELVWNSLDAEATTVDISVKRTPLEAVENVTVVDDGHGFAPDEVSALMSSVGDSWKAAKADRKTKYGARLLHGKNGEGRLQALAFGDHAQWESVTSSDNGNVLTEFTIRRSNIRSYEWNSRETERAVGTTVVVTAGTSEPRALVREDAPERLLKHLALYLTQYPDVAVTFDGLELNPEPLIERQDFVSVDYSDAHGPVTLVVIEWHEPCDRAIFLCDANGATLHEVDARIHAPGFNFTAYAKWEGFRAHEANLLLVDIGSPEIGPALDSIREALREHFRTRASDRTRSVVDEWRDEEVYPYLEAPADDVERAEQALFNYVAVTAESAVNRIDNRKAKALSLRAMKIAVARDPGAIEDVFREVLSLSEEKLSELHDLLKKTSLASIIGTMKKITGRQEYLSALESLLFDTTTAPQVLERAHLQEIIGSEPWLFGEEFALHISDKGLSALLEAHVGLLGRETTNAGVVRDSQGRVRRVDFMFGRALELNRNRREHLVVEIKRPTVVLSRDELSQIEDYAIAVAKDNRFDKEITEWDFILVSTDMDDYVVERATQPSKRRGLAFELQEGRVRVWVHRWNTIIADARHRLQFVKDQLKYDPSADQAVSYLQENFPDYVPASISDLDSGPPQNGRSDQPNHSTEPR